MLDASMVLPDGRRFSPPDMALPGDSSLAAGFLESVGEAVRQGTVGYAQDVVVQGRPWTFDAATISVPTVVFHGLVDTIVPLTHGHLRILNEIPRLAADLARSSSTK